MCTPALRYTIGAAFAGLMAASAAAQVPAAHRTVLIHAAVFDGTPTWQRDRTIVIDDSMISAIDSGAAPAARTGDVLIDLHGRFVIPGLIDAHVHLATDPDHEDARPRAVARLAAAIRGGVTTVRDMAGDTRRLADYARDAAVTDTPSPDIRYAALFAGPAFFADPRTHAASAGAVAGQVPWMRAITDTTDLRQAVAEAKGTGATAIKLYAALDSLTVARVVAEAHRQGMLVWAHAALRPAMPRDMAASGLDAMSHGNLLALAIPPAQRTALQRELGTTTGIESPPLDSVLRAMAARHIVFDPTLVVMDSGAQLTLAAAVTRRAHQLGVLISTGTDSIGAADSMSLPNVHLEIALLVRRAGFTPVEALVAATENGARTLGIFGHVGSLVPGKRADLVVLAADPLRDITNTTTVRLVMKRGVIFRRDASIDSR
ncbi:MAG TPA: amidohydrolase family protein [Gemmatimonadales bacterium]